jgi:hypothetical protein
LLEPTWLSRLKELYTINIKRSFFLSSTLLLSQRQYSSHQQA